MNKFLKTIKSFNRLYSKESNTLDISNILPLQSTHILYSSSDTTTSDLTYGYYSNSSFPTHFTMSRMTSFDTIPIFMDNKLIKSDKKIFNHKEEIFLKKLDEIKKKK